MTLILESNLSRTLDVLNTDNPYNTSRPAKYGAPSIKTPLYSSLSTLLLPLLSTPPSPRAWTLCLPTVRPVTVLPVKIESGDIPCD